MEGRGTSHGDGDATLARGLARMLIEDGGIDRSAAVFTRHFVLGNLDGRVHLGPDGRSPLPGEIERFARNLEVEPIEELGGGYLIVHGARAGPGEHGAWTVCLQDGRLAAAFEHPDRDRAVAAVPKNLRPRSDIELVEEAMWAFLERDVPKLLDSLADDYVYRDLQVGGYLAGASQAVDALLMASPDFTDRGYRALDIRDLGSGVIESTGVATEPGADGNEIRFRWMIRTCVEGGRITSTTREPDIPIED